MPERDPYKWPDPGDLHAKTCEQAATIATLRAQVAALEAERDAMLCRLCSAALHDGRNGRVGERLFWRAVIGT